MPPINTGDRKEIGKPLQSLAAGDQVLATRIDRLARSMFELFAIVKTIIDAGDNFSTREMTLTMGAKDLFRSSHRNPHPPKYFQRSA